MKKDWMQQKWKTTKQHLNNPLFKNAYFMMTGNVLSSALGFIFWIIVARLYATEVVGLTSAVLSSVGLLAIFSELGFGIGIIRFLPNAGKIGNDMLNTCLTLNGFASIAIAIIFLIGISFWSPALLEVRQDQLFSIAFVIIATVTTLQSLILNTFLAKRNAKFAFYSTLINNLLKLVLVIFFAAFLKSSFGLFVSVGLAGLIAQVIAVVWFLPKVQSGFRPFPKIKREVLGNFLRYSISNYIGRCLMQITPLILPLMVVNILSAEMNAYFVIAWAVASVLLVIPSSIFTSLFVEGSNNQISFRADSIKSLKQMLLLLLPITLVILIVADKLLLFFGNAYSDNGALLLRIVVLSATPYGINYFYISIARVNKNIRSVIKVTAATTCLSLGLSYFLMLKIGLVGIGIGYFTGQSVVAIAVIILLWRGYHTQYSITVHGEIS